MPNDSQQGRDKAGETPVNLLVLFVATILGAMGIQAPRNSSSSSPTAASVPVATQSGEKSADGKPEDGLPPVVLLREYFNRNTSDSVVSTKDEAQFKLTSKQTFGTTTFEMSAKVTSTGRSGESSSRSGLIENIVRNESKARFRCLIATVPDPIDSHFQHMFDEVLQSISMGLGLHSYSLDSYRFPWSNELALARQNRTGAGAGAEFSRRQKHPGALLFRRDPDARSTNKDPSELLLLLLVGETPTGGVHRAALTDALDLAMECYRFSVGTRSAAGETPKFCILGPTFSGSANSLRATCAKWWDGCQTSGVACEGGPIIQIRSGSATSDSNKDLLNVTFCTGLTLKFDATVHPDQAGLALAAVDHLHNVRRIPLDKIAILCESATGYGIGSWNYESLKRLREFSFPFSLSDLRSELAKQQPNDPHTEEVRNLGLRRNLNVSFEQSIFARDMLPSYSSMTPAMMDAALDVMLSTLRRDGIQAVGLQGTDIRDKLFLARQIHDSCPDVQLFTTESDILFTHADQAPYLRGMLVASTYPLFLRCRDWIGTHTKDSNRRITFTSDAAEGTFNATVSLANEFIGSNKKDEVFPLADYGWPGLVTTNEEPNRHNRPPIWLTMVGESAMWPVATVTRPTAFEDCLPKGEEDPNPADVTAEYVYEPVSTVGVLVHRQFRFPSIAVLFAFSLAALLMSGTFLCPEGSNVWTLPLARTRSMLGWSNTETSKLGAAVLLLSLCVIQWSLATPHLLALRLWCCHGFAVEPHLLEWRWINWSVPVVTSLIAFAAIVLTTVAFVALLWPRTRSHLGVMALSMAGLNAAIAVAWAGRGDDPSELLIYVERAGSLTSGVSPIVPWILAWSVIGLWGWSHLLRSRLVNEQPLARDLARLLSPVDSSTTSLTRSAQRENPLLAVDNTMTCPVATPRSFTDLLLVVVAVNLFVLAACDRWIGTAEGWGFDLAFRVVLALAVLACLESLWRVKQSCRAFQRLLGSLDRHPMRSAFLRVPERLASTVTAQLTASIPDIRELKLVPAELTELMEKSSSLTSGANGESTSNNTDDVKQELHTLTKLLWELEDSVVTERTLDETIRVVFETLPNHKRQAHVIVDDFVEERILSKAEIAKRFNELVVAQSLVRRLSERLWAHWNEHPLVPLYQDTGSSRVDSLPPNVLLLERIETVVAMVWVYAFRHFFYQIRWHMIFSVATILLLLMSVDSYPFQPHSMLLLLGIALLSTTALVVMHAIWKFNCSAVLSELEGSTPHRFNFSRSAAIPFLTLVATPIISVVAILVPSVGRLLFGWMSGVSAVFGG